MLHYLIYFVYVIVSALREMGLNNEHENQYMPSRWSKNYNGDSKQIEDAFVQYVTNASEEVKRTITYKSDIHYGRRNGQLLDTFGDDALPSDAKIFVYLHGGYWQSINKDISSYAAKPQFNSGIKSVIADYDLAPKVNMETIVTEIKELADFVLSKAERSKSNSVWFVGHSAGAHLAAQLMFNDYLESLTDNKRNIFKGLVLISGIYDLNPIVHTSVNKALNLTRKDIELYSPVLQINNPLTIARSVGLQVLVTLGQYDSPAFHKQSQDFTQFLKNNGIKVKYMEIANEDHFTIAEKLGDTEFQLSKEIIHLIKS